MIVIKSTRPRDAVRAMLLVCGCLMAVVGCAYNGAKLHSEMSATRIEDSVRKHFHRGMDSFDVCEKLDSLGVSHSSGSWSEGARAQRPGVRAWLAPSGLHFDWAFVPTNQMEGLQFWFDDRSGLDHVTYRDFDDEWNPRYRDIPLGPVPPKSQE